MSSDVTSDSKGEIMKYSNKLTASAVLLSLFASNATAEVNFGGWVGYEYDVYQEDDGDRFIQNYVRFNGVLTYTTGDLVLGFGNNHEFTKFDDSDGWESIYGDFYYLVGYQNFTVTYGHIWGAGNIFPEDYFALDDATSNATQNETVRVDAEFGEHSVAISYELNTDSDDNPFEVGYQGKFGSFDVVVGYEFDQQDLGIIIGQDRGDWGWQMVTLQDLDDGAEYSQIGATVFYDVMDGLSVAGNYSMTMEGDFHSFGMVATYDVGVGTLKAEYTQEEDNNSFELGIVIPFGAPQPAAASRFTLKEYNRGMIY